MRIYRVNDQEQMNLPQGFTVARDSLCTPVCPRGYVGKVEWIDTQDPSPIWRTSCDIQDNASKLGKFLHDNLCPHDDRCTCTYNDLRYGKEHQIWENRAREICAILHDFNHLQTEEGVFNAAMRIAAKLKITKD